MKSTSKFFCFPSKLTQNVYIGLPRKVLGKSLLKLEFGLDEVSNGNACVSKQETMNAGAAESNCPLLAVNMGPRPDSESNLTGV